MDFGYKPLKLSDLSFSDTTTEALRDDATLGRKLASVAKELHVLRESARDLRTSLVDYYAGEDAHYKLGAASWMEESKRLLADASTPTGVILVALKNLLGPGVEAYEPDTIRIELEDNEGVVIPPVNFDKIMAGITLLEVPAFYMEVLTFSNSIMSFNDEPIDTDVLQEASPAQVAWAVYEAELILQEHMMFEPSFDDEPVQYTATVLHRNGMVLAPKLLSFAQDALNKMNVGSSLKPEEVRNAWDALDKSALASRTFSETPLDIQLAKLAAVHLYVSDRTDAYQKALRSLSRA